MSGTPVGLVEETLISLILAREIDGLLPPVRDLATRIGTSETTIMSAKAAVEQAGYLRRLPNKRLHTCIPERLDDQRLTELTQALVATAKERGASFDDLRHLLAAHMIVADLAESGDDEQAGSLRPIRDRLRQESARPRPPRTHRNGDEPGNWLRRQAEMNHEALMDDHSWD